MHFILKHIKMHTYFFISFQHSLQNLAFLEFLKPHLLHLIFFFLFFLSSIILVESRKINIITDHKIETKIGHNIIKNPEIILHIIVIGIIQASPEVVSAYIHHHIVFGKDEKTSLFHQVTSAIYNKVVEIISVIKILKVHIINSVLCFCIHLNNLTAIGIFSNNSNILKILKILKITNSGII